MRFQILSAVVGLVLSLPTLSKTFDHSHKLWTKQLQTYLDKDGSVRYKVWKREQTTLKQYLSQLESVSDTQFKTWTTNEQKAYLINAYNAFTIKLILMNFPVDSIKDIGSLFSSPWKKSFFSLLGGKIKALDPIEHEWLRKRPEFKDPRIHAAVNCASISCPQLRGEAFVGAKLDQQLNDASLRWLQDPSRNTFEQGKARISKIFDWFEEDFGGSKQGVLQFIKTHAPEKYQALGESPEISYLHYDWGLNSAR